MKRVVAYCRVSTGSKDQANSLENQQTYFEREIKRNMEYEFAGIYADRGISGTKLKRPEFDRMLYDAGLDIVEIKNSDNDKRKNFIKYATVPSSTRKPKFDIIMVKNTSRFARNILVEDILRDLSKNEVYVHFLDLDKTTENNDDITYIQLFQTFDERESRDKSKKSKFGIEEGAKKGVISANSRLYGYNYIQVDNRLEIIPHEADVIKKIFELYSEGNGIRRIINYLDGNNFYTREGKSFCKSTIKRILSNEKYAGINARLKYDTGAVFNKNSYPHIKPKGEWVTPKKSEKIPAIISEELFNQCQALLQGKVNHTNQLGIYKGTTEYAGLIYCGKCGNAYNSNIDRGRRFYNCKLKKQEGISACNNKNINEKLIKELLTSDIYINLRYSCLEEILKELKKAADGNINKLKSPQFDKIEEIEARLQQIKEESKRLISLYTKERISEEEFTEERIPIEKQREELTAELNLYKVPKGKLIDEIKRILNSIRSLSNIQVKDKYSTEEIISDINKIYVYPDNKMEIDFKPFVNLESIKVDWYKATLKYA